MFSLLETLETQEDKDHAILLYECFSGILYSYANSMLKNKEFAEDMVHDTYAVLLTHLDHIDPEVYDFLHDYQREKKKEKELTLKTYSYITNNCIYKKALAYAEVILRHKIYDFCKKSNCIIYIDNYHDDIMESNNDSPESVTLQNELQQVMIASINRLSYPYKDVIYLYYYHNFPTAFIAETLEKKPDNIRQILSRARNMIRDFLEKEGYGNE